MPYTWWTALLVSPFWHCGVEAVKSSAVVTGLSVAKRANRNKRVEKKIVLQNVWVYTVDINS